MICGIIAFAVALEEIVHHPTTCRRERSWPLLRVWREHYSSGSPRSPYWRTSGRVLVARLAILAAVRDAFAVVVVSSLEPAWQLAVLALGLLAIVVVEGHEPQFAAIDATDGDLPLTDD